MSFACAGARLAHGNVTIMFSLEAPTLLVKILVHAQAQSPEMNDSACRTNLILIAAHHSLRSANRLSMVQRVAAAATTWSRVSFMRLVTQ